MVVGYSGTPLAKKLGIDTGAVVVLIDGPDDFVATLDPLPAGVRLRRSLGQEPDLVVAFTTQRKVLERRVASAGRAIFPAGALWIAWPKRASGVATDITEDTIRDVALPLGLVDNKVCAISDVWSGLRLVWRKERRSGPRPTPS